MPVFVYKAADRRGQTIDGVMDAPDARAVVERLQKDAYYPIKITAHGERAPLFSLGGSRVGQRDLLALTQQLATLFEAGLPLDRALTILEELAPNARVKAIVSDLLRSVRGGASFSEALAKHHPRPFSRLYINMVRAGEKGGVLEVALRRLAEFLEARRQRLRQGVQVLQCHRLLVHARSGLEDALQRLAVLAGLDVGLDLLHGRLRVRVRVDHARLRLRRPRQVAVEVADDERQHPAVEVA